MSDDANPDPPAEEAAPSPAAKPMTAKEKAAARRRRILEAGRERMDVVSGEASAPSKDAAGGEASGAAPDAAEAGGEAGAEEESSRPSGSSRLAAMRRRRFKQKAAAAAAAKEEDGGAAAKEEGGEGKKEDEEEKAAAEVKPSEEDADDAAAAADENDGEGDGDGEGGEKKKYLGVAKMRRMRLAEQKKKREEEEAATGGLKSSPSGRKPVPPSLSTVARETVKTHRTPIFLHLLTAVLIFLGGMGLGVRSSPGYAGGPNAGVAVTEGFAPVDEGIGAVRALQGLLSGGGGKTGASSDAMDARERLLQESLGGSEETSEFDEEFAEEKPRGATGKEPNIDPLFQVDLDEYTSGPGLLMSAGRFAVSVHRLNLWFFYYLPLSIFQTLLALPRNLLGSPPLLFLLAVILRAIGRDAMGGGLPDPDATGGSGGKDDKEETKDLLMMALAAVRNFATNTFPTAAAVWRVIRDARVDMYVALCGLFVGMVLPTKIQMAALSAGGEEL